MPGWKPIGSKEPRQPIPSIPPPNSDIPLPPDTEPQPPIEEPPTPDTNTPIDEDGNKEKVYV